MEYVTTLEELEEKITDNRLQAVFLTAKNCSVCTVDKPIVEKIATKYEFPTYLSLIHISEPTRPVGISRMPSSA